MAADAIALLRPKNLEKLKPYLDLDGEDGDGEGDDRPYAEALEDGSLLVHTFQPFAVFQGDLDEGRLWLEGLGEALSHAHDADRVLFFPDDREPEGTTYQDVIDEMEEHGVWIPFRPLDAGEAAERNARLASDLEEAKRMVARLTGDAGDEGPAAEELEALADKLRKSATGTDPGFGVAKMFEDVQKQLMGAFGIPAPTGDTIVVLVDRAIVAELDEADVVDAFELGDGSMALQTYVPLDSKEALRAELSGPRKDWIATHTDARGVPIFSSAHLDDLEDVASYDEVIARLGDAVTFLPR